MSTYLMGFDVGGCSIRCGLVDVADGRLVTATRRWAPVPLPQTGFFAFRTDTDLCWRLCGEAAGEALASAGAGPEEVAGVAVAGLRFSLVLVDEDGAALWSAPNHDARAAEEALRLADELGPVLVEHAGHWPLPIFAAPRLLWLAEHDPTVLERAESACSLNDWLGACLSGVTATDLSQAGESLLFDGAGDGTAGEWAADLIERLGLPRRLFPEVRAAGEVLGPLTPAAAAHLGLRPGTPVAVGGADTQCGLLGMGVVEPGRLGIVAGSTTPLQLVAAGPAHDREGRLWRGRHVVAGRRLLESNAGAMGDTLEWFGGVLAPDSPDPVLRLVAEAAAAAPGAGGAVSSLGAQVMDARDMMSMPVGTLALTHLDGAGECRPERGRARCATGGAAGRRGATRRGNVARAVLEGMAFAIRANAEQLREAVGTEHTAPGGERVAPGAEPRVSMAGGMSRSPFFTQLVCDVLDEPLLVSRVGESSVVGAAICAGVGAGVYGSLEDGATALARTRRLEPDGGRAFLYRELYADWARLSELREPVERSAAGIALRDQMERVRQATGAGRREMRGAVDAGQAEAWGATDAGLAETRGAAEVSPEAPPRLRILATAGLDERAVRELQELGDVVHEDYREALRLLSDEALVEALRGVDVFITEVDLLDAEALAACDDLRVVAACRGRAVNVDVAACTALGIPVLSAPGRNADAVADLTLAFMLMLLRSLPAATGFLRSPGAEAGDMGRMGQAHSELQGAELGRRTVGLVGFGDVGRAVARRVGAFGARVLVTDPYVSPEAAAAADAALVGLEELLETADLVSLHAPVTDETRGLMDAARLARMKEGALLVNTARAALLDEEALAAALRSGHLGGAALDVFAQEPPGPEHPLLNAPNVIATPHIGGNTVDVAAHQGRMVAADLRRLVSGLPPLHVLNPETLETFTWRGERRRLEAAELRRLAGGSAPAVSDVHAAAAPSAATTAAPTGSAEGAPPEAPRSPSPRATQSAPSPAAARMERVVTLFLERAAADEALLRFAARRTVGSHYVVSDLGLEFHIGFGDGRVTAGLGPPEHPADVRLKARGEVLDAILTGRLGGNRAAMTGKLSFSGDLRTAMGLQKVQKDFIRLYSAASEEVGAVDFDAAAPAPDVSAGRLSVTPPASPGAAVEAEEEADEAARLRVELTAITEELFATGLITPTGGNASVRIPGTDEAWITPSQLYKGALSADLMVRVDLEGEGVDPDAPAPSSERHLHCAVYRARPDVGAVVHAHPAYTSILGMCDLPFLPVDTEAAFFGELPRVPFLMPGSRELAEAATQALGDGAAVLLRNHGLLVAGGSLRRTADMAAVIEHVAHLLWGCRALGAEPSQLPEETVEMLREIGEMLA